MIEGMFEITLGRRWRTNTKRFIGKTHMQGFAIGLGVHGDGLDAHLLARPDDPDGDLAAIGD